MNIAYNLNDFREKNFLNTPEKYKFYFKIANENIENDLICLLNKVFYSSKIEKGIVIEHDIDITIRDIFAPINNNDFFNYWGDEISFYFNNDEIILKYNIDDNFFILGIKNTMKYEFNLDMVQNGFLPIAEFIASLDKNYFNSKDKEKMYHLYGTVPHKHYYKKKRPILTDIAKVIKNKNFKKRNN